MNLKKRIYLLTPVLVLCCVLAAGFFVKETAPVEAATIEKLNKFTPTKLKDILDIEETMSEKDWAESNYQYKDAAERFDIKEFDVNLFDYDGREWNAFSAYRFNKQNDANAIFAFKNGNTRSFSAYPYYDGNTYPLYDLWAGVNAGGTSAKQGILDSALDSYGMPQFNESVIGGLGAGFREHLLFNPNTNWNSYPGQHQISGSNGASEWYWQNYKFNDHNFDFNQIRLGTYTGKFQFVYDNQTGYYTYNSAQSHAQFNTASIDSNDVQHGKVELYSETLGATNGTVDQTKNIGDVGDNNFYNSSVSFSNANRFEFQQYKTGNGGSGNGSISIGSNEKFDNNYGYCKFAISTTSSDPHIEPGLGLTKFTLPIEINDEDQNEDNNCSDYIDKGKLEYVYVKFRCYTNQTNINYNTSFRLIYSNLDNKPHSNQVYYEGEQGSVYTLDNDESGAKYVRYDYDYTLKSNNTEWIEIKIPVDGVNFDIQQIIICPVFFPNIKINNIGKEFIDVSSVWSQGIIFELMEFGLGYNYVGKNKDSGRDAAAGSSFLPFERIENSYPGETVESGTIDSVDERMDAWLDNNALTNTAGTTAHRAVVNRYNENGLTAIEKSDGNTGAHFGMSMEVDFFIPNDRLTEDDEDIKFIFTGDDDLWVFIDDQLILDLGGCHTQESGSINVSERQVWYTAKPVIGVTATIPTETTSANDAKGASFGDKLDTKFKQSAYDEIFAPGEHTMKIFYMERESGASNCFISFNLPQLPEGGITVSAEAKMKDGSNVPADFNNDNINDDKIVVKNEGGDIAYYNDSAAAPNALVSYVYTAAYKVLETNKPLYSGEYQLYKTSDPENTTVSGLKLKELMEPTLSGNYYNYKVQFTVPAGYTATIILPDDTVINSVSEAKPTDDNIVPGITYSNTTIDPSLKYVLQGGDDYKDTTAKKETITRLDYAYAQNDFTGFSMSTLVVGADASDVAVLRNDFINYYEREIITVKFNKNIVLSNANKDLNADNNLNSNEELNYSIPEGASLKNDFEGMLFKFKIQYKDLDGTYVTSALKYIVRDSEGTQVGGDYYTSSNGEFYMEDDYVIEMELPENGQGQVEIIVEELTGNENLPGNYTYDSTVISSYNGNNEDGEDINGDLDASYPTMDLTANENYRYEFTNKYIWNIDFITKPDDKGVNMDIDEDVKVIFENKLGEENWLDGEGSVDNDFSVSSRKSYPENNGN